MARKIEEAARPVPPRGSIPNAARDVSCRERLLTAKDAADVLRLSASWLAKARMRGDGPPFVKLGRSIRYSEAVLAHWMRSRIRLSTSER